METLQANKMNAQELHDFPSKQFRVIGISENENFQRCEECNPIGKTTEMATILNTIFIWTSKNNFLL